MNKFIIFALLAATAWAQLPTQVIQSGGAGGGGTIASTTSPLKGDGSGGAVAASTTGTGAVVLAGAPTLTGSPSFGTTSTSQIQDGNTYSVLWTTSNTPLYFGANGVTAFNLNSARTLLDISSVATTSVKALNAYSDVIYDPTASTGASSWSIRAGAGDLGTTKLVKGFLNDGTTEKWSITRDGAAAFTTLNKLTVTAPATGSTLTIADGKTLTASNSLTFTGTDGNSFAFPSGSDTVVTLGATQTLAAKTLTTPTIASFTNATHNHQNAAGGGSLDGAAIGSGTVVDARLPQAISTTASPQFVAETLTQGTITSATPNISGTVTWNASGVTFTGWKLNVTSTASAAASLLADLQIGGSTKWNVQKDGQVTNTGGVDNTTWSAMIIDNTGSVGNSNYYKSTIRFNSRDGKIATVGGCGNTFTGLCMWGKDSTSIGETAHIGVDSNGAVTMAAGPLDAQAVLTVSTSSPVTVSTSGYFFNNSAGAMTFNLPTITSALVGRQICFFNDSTRTGAITLQAPASTVINRGGTNGSTAGTLVSAGALGDGACVVAVTTTKYLATISSGTWTNN